MNIIEGKGSWGCGGDDLKLKVHVSISLREAMV